MAYFQKKITLDEYLINFSEGYKGILERGEESFYKMRITENNI